MTLSAYSVKAMYERRKMKPILFNTDMVKAILGGRKTVTRRVIKDYVPNDAQWGYTAFTPTGCISCRGDNGKEYGEKFYKLPYQAGDTLYVRETWAKEKNSKRYLYKADKVDYLYKELHSKWKWKPSIHMPKEAARIFLRVTNVSVAKLHDITEEQAIAEGAERLEGFCTAIDSFKTIWDSTIKGESNYVQYGWHANPYVWVIEFERIAKEDAI